MDGKLDTNKLRRAMQARNIKSISALSAIAGIHRNSLTPYLNGQRSAFAPTILSIARALGVSPSELLVDSNISDPYGVLPLVAALLRRCDSGEQGDSREPNLSFFLFGSRAEGREKRFSDYDIGVTGGLRPLGTKSFLEMKEIFSELCDNLPVKVDLLNFDQAPVWFLAQFDSPCLFICGSKESFDILRGRIDGIKEALKKQTVAA